jgi:glutamate synthase (NADPH/NADH) large chain
MKYGLPEKHGLYDPANEKDACGVGFVAQIKGVASHQIVKDANRILCNMDHRGARGSETNTGDGAGMLTAVPDKLLRREAKEELGIDLPEPGRYGVGNIFLPTDDEERAYCKAAFVRAIETQGQKFLGWRPVPTDPDGANLGPTALESMPHIEQLFIGAADGLDQNAFERQLYTIRKSAASPLRVDESLKQRSMLYACSLSSKTIIYKGMLACEQVLPFYGDLTDPDYETHLAMVHSRFATNTFPTWERAQPLRCLSHNGEINTLRGNKNAMHSRQGVVESELFGDDLRKLFPVAEPGLSDSGTLDNVLEFLYMNGRTMPEAAMLMIPEAWQRHEHMPQVKRDFYEYHSCLMEPWDGPASIAFTDGTVIGAVLDRNGLRPSRYYLTHDDRVIMASEVGVLPVPPETVKHKGRLKPGRMFLIDFEQGRMIPDVELKHDIASQRPYGEWLGEQRLKLTELPVDGEAHGFDADTLLPRMQSFGYTTETMQFMLRPMIEQKRDPVGSMGNDSALAVLSDQPRLTYDYFKQLFAQVTNPPIDSIREEVIMGVECYIGPEKNLLTTTAEHAHRLRIPHPILTNEEVRALKTIDERGWRSKLIDITWPRSEGAEGLEPALQRIRQDAEQAVDDGYSLILLTDRAAGKDRIPVSALLATGAAHHHLVATEKRTRVGIVVATGEAREVHHHCCLIGYGADAINPYLAFEALWQERRLGTLDAETFPDDDSIVAGYRKAVAKGMLKVFAKMGISTLQSYKGAQIFEAVGLNSSVIDLCFAGTRTKTSHGSRSSRTTGNSIGVPMASGICGTRRRSPTYRWQRARTVATRTGASQSTRTTVLGIAVRCVA